MTTLVVRPHTNKKKPLVTPVYTLKKLNALMQQTPKPNIVQAKKNISSGEDCVLS